MTNRIIPETCSTDFASRRADRPRRITIPCSARRHLLGLANPNRTCDDADVGFFRELSRAAVLAFFSAAVPSLACTVVYQTVTVGQNFKVKVSGLSGSVAGLKVGLYSGAIRKVEAVTNKEGIALFQSVQPGSYFLSTDHDTGMPDGAAIEVKRAESSEITVPLRWPSVKPISVGSLKGVLRLPDWFPGQSQSSVSLELLEGISGMELNNTNTDGNGAFAFPGVARGLYFLAVTLSGFRAGLIAVSVEPGISTAGLDLDMGLTSCGLYYVDHSDCPQTNVHLDRLGGRVVDPTQAAISNAEILLFEPGGKLVEQVRSNSVGGFPSLRPADGTYQLSVRSAGFTPLRGTITFDSKGVNSPLEFQLGFGGLCGRTKDQ